MECARSDVGKSTCEREQRVVGQIHKACKNIMYLLTMVIHCLIHWQVL